MKHAASKIALIFVLFGLFGNMAVAETPEEEIARLKKENELLEQQKKDEIKEKKKGFLGFCRGKHKNTGCFIGAEAGYGIGSHTTLRADAVETVQNQTARLSILSFQEAIIAPINLILGWQWYFRKDMGIHIKTHIGYSVVGDTSHTGEMRSESDSSIAPMPITLSLSSQALNYGFEVQYRYDFLRKKWHTLGLHAGIGYEFTTFMGNTINIDTTNNSLDLNSYTNSAFTSTIGAHYYLNSNHQFALFYKYRGYSSLNITQNINLQGLNMQTQYMINPDNIFGISYAYRF